MSRQYICPMCQGEFNQGEGHYCSAMKADRPVWIYPPKPALLTRPDAMGLSGYALADQEAKKRGAF